MNVKTIILSEEEFNNLKNANTLEQLLDFKNNIINQGSSNNIQTNNNTIVQNDIDKYIGIRILSKSEFNKYIKNSTADGSITANSNEVFHRDIHAPDEYLFCDRTKVGGYRETYTTNETVTYIEEFTQDNTLAEAFLANGYIFRARSRAKQGAYSAEFRRELIKRNKNFNYIQENQRIHARNSETDAIINLTYYEHMCFRPVFETKDNNKSKNTYY